LALAVAGFAIVLLANQGSIAGGPEIPVQHPVGSTWTNVRTGRSGGPDYVASEIPFESTGGCGGDTFAHSISWRHGWYLQAPSGPRGGYEGRYLRDVSLPDRAAFTGWQHDGEQLWIVATDKTGPGEYKYLYVVTPHAAERWPRATFGCM
jgi:hypothetical protein